jgi:hypothetical protein
MNLFKLEVKRWWNWGWGFFSVEDQVARARPQDQKKKKDSGATSSFWQDIYLV